MSTLESSPMSSITVQSYSAYRFKSKSYPVWFKSVESVYFGILRLPVTHLKRKIKKYTQTHDCACLIFMWVILLAH